MRIAKWVVRMFYYGKLQFTDEFPTKEAALAYYELKLGACRYGLVGWSVEYPQEAK